MRVPFPAANTATASMGFCVDYLSVCLLLKAG